MLPSIVEKIGYGGVTVVLVLLGRTAPGLLPTAIIDLVLAALFAESYRRTAAR
jgi:hypothetical protein